MVDPYWHWPFKSSSVTTAYFVNSVFFFNKTYPSWQGQDKQVNIVTKRNSCSLLVELVISWCLARIRPWRDRQSECSHTELRNCHGLSSYPRNLDRPLPLSLWLTVEKDIKKILFKNAFAGTQIHIGKLASDLDMYVIFHLYVTSGIMAGRGGNFAPGTSFFIISRELDLWHTVLGQSWYIFDEV